MLWVCVCIVLFLQFCFSVYAYLRLIIWHGPGILGSFKIPVEGSSGDFIQVISCSLTCRDTCLKTELCCRATENPSSIRHHGFCFLLSDDAAALYFRCDRPLIMPRTHPAGLERILAGLLTSSLKHYKDFFSSVKLIDCVLVSFRNLRIHK